MKAISAALLVATAAAPALEVKGITPDETVAYKKAGDVTLRLHVFKPHGHKAGDRRPAMVFFFGGGWVGGSPSQFYPHCRHLAGKGMVAMAAEYRVKKQHRTTPIECVKDGKSAVRYIRKHAAELGIDPGKIAAGGGSAGGHVAAATGNLAGYDEEDEDQAVSSKPNLLVLFNPVFDNGPEDGWGHKTVADYWRKISPAHNLRKGAPPTVVFLGTEDKLIPVAVAERYKERMEAAGARCDLHLYEGAGHGFFNQSKEGGKYYRQTVQTMDEFLASFGYLPAGTQGP
ncbi:MAG: alpha/beta hydrolase fold domain-containing protein [Akkermansiaceae bacterium]|nr:alpha/beta hydrolase fold domain-containing protein [Akkermansiaceae bacterium]